MFFLKLVKYIKIPNLIDLMDSFAGKTCLSCYTGVCSDAQMSGVKLVLVIVGTGGSKMIKMAQFAAFCIIKKNFSHGACPQAPVIR